MMQISNERNECGFLYDLEKLSVGFARCFVVTRFYMKQNSKSIRRLLILM